ncbi:MAG TPA: aminotransferase class III-fold pyridoxal phosphate-dependent enzyme [Limnobacter sp.]|nr:aminotransferase class III-fold pyridoxal phosphate-dependent enzyme [Limnobacter sp.]
MTHTLAIVQARMGSTRLPGKVMAPIQGKPMIEVLLHRLSKSKKIDQVILATSTDPKNDPLCAHVLSLGYLVHRGSENDVLTRFHEAAQLAPAATHIVRITGDCPLVDPNVVDACIQACVDNQADYVSNVAPPTYPDGLDVEVFTRQSLNAAHTEALEPFDREHVTPHLRKPRLFKTGNITHAKDCSGMRWTVDDPADLQVIQNVFEHFKPNLDFSWEQVLQLANKQPELFEANTNSHRNAGASMSTGQKLWGRAKRVIAGGNMLLSKRPEMFLPDQWPTYFSKSKGCSVWDLDNNELTDMSIMGVGTNILGYGHPEVDQAVLETVQKGNMSTLNCPEEVLLAERLVDMHPFADMVRFARSGGEANAIAIRIARAASGKEKVAFCGYHGWHDWYLSANLADDENLSGHLLPGLEPNGVPRSLRGTVLPFVYNDIEGLKNLMTQHDVGVIKMEVSRNMGPENNFLHEVRKLADQHNAVLIFDECTSGFRETFGGLHKKYGVEPDMAMFGKAMGNGYAITATIGRRSVMEAAQTSFISSTFWTERIGPTAALKTLEVMERTQSWQYITEKGLQIRQRWQQLADLHGLKISHWGLPALTGYSFSSSKALEYKTLVSQEMLAKGFLAGNSVYVSVAHTDQIIDRYFDALDPIFKTIAACERGDLQVESLLKGPVCHAGFKRLN